MTDTDLFAQLSSFPAVGATDLALFAHAGSTWGVLTQHYSGPVQRYASTTRLLRWTGAAFVDEHAVPSLGARWATPFTVGARQYFAQAQTYTGSAFRHVSRVLEFNGTALKVVQEVATAGATAAATWTFDDPDAPSVVWAESGDDGASSAASQSQDWQCRQWRTGLD